jgi:GNAT superfamily N-acetyltransferase
MTVDTDQLALAMAECMELTSAVIATGWVRRVDGVIAGVSGFPIAELNGAFTVTRDPDPSVLGELLDDVAASGLPYTVQLRPGVDDSVVADRLLVRNEAIPLMALEAGGARLPAPPQGLRIRQLAPFEAMLHVRTMIRGFEMAEEPWSQLITPAMLALPGARFYLGEVDGAAVTTAAGVTLGRCVSVMNVATVPEHRSHGYGAAMTARAAADGFASGARVAFLQSSPAGQGVYARIGFSVVERWMVWASSAGPPGPG